MFLATLPRLCLDAHCVPGPFSFACLLILKDRDFFVNASQLRASARSLHSGLFWLDDRVYSGYLFYQHLLKRLNI